MEELYELLEIDQNEPVQVIVEAVKDMQEAVASKSDIITGLQSQIKNFESQIDSISKGVAEARVKDIVRKVQSQTGYYVSKEKMETLNNKAAKFIYADEGAQESIMEDMKAHTIAYGVKVGMDERINSLIGSREDSNLPEQEKRYRKAKSLIDNGKAKNWTEANAMVLKQEQESKKEEV